MTHPDSHITDILGEFRLPPHLGVVVEQIRTGLAFGQPQLQDRGESQGAGIGGPVSTILLVEDDPDIRELVAYKLTRGGFDVIEAADGPAALHAARERPPDAVILDIRLPRLSGIEVCRELRAAPAT